MRTWILIANAAEAEVYAIRDADLTGLKKPEWRATHRKSRAKGCELVSDRPGRGRGAMTMHGAFVLQPRSAPKLVEAEHFADQLAAKLATACKQRRFDLLALVAPPHFLGLLTDRLGAQVLKWVVARLHKDLVHLEPRELATHLKPVRSAIRLEQRRREAAA